MSAAGQTTQFTDLPFMVQCHIMSHLSLPQLLTSVSPVSRYFYDLTREPRFWLQLDFTRSKARLTLEQLRQLLTGAPLLESLIVSRESAAENASGIVVEVLTLCPRLAYLQMAYLNPTADCLLDGLCRRPSRRLRHLDLSGSDSLTPDLVSLIAEAFPCLESLCLPHCRRACDSSTGRLGERLPRLSYVNLEEDIAPGKAVADLITSRRDTLERVALDVSDCAAKHLAPLGECSRLRMLHCYFAEDIEDELLHKTINRLAPSLESLTLRKGLRLTASGFELLTSCVDFPHLTHLDLTECRGVTDSAMCPLLTRSGGRLDLLVLNWCWVLTDATLDCMLDSCGQLRSVSLVGLHKLSCQQLVRVPRCMPRLRYLDLRSCNAVQDQVCRRLAAELPQLCIVDFYGSVVEGFVGGGFGECGGDTAASAVGFAFTESWTRPLDMLRM